MPLPLGPLIQGGAGILQSIIGGIGAGKARRQLADLESHSPRYQPNKSILDYYNKALARYNVNPYQSSLYQQANQQAQRGLSSGLSTLQGRGAALAGISSLIQNKNDALLKAGVAAENQQGQNLAQLGNAASAKRGEERTAFDINEMQPFQRKYNALTSKAAGQNALLNAGLSNIFGAGSSLSQRDMYKQIYGNKNQMNYDQANNLANSFTY